MDQNEVSKPSERYGVQIVQCKPSSSLRTVVHFFRIVFIINVQYYYR